VLAQKQFLTRIKIWCVLAQIKINKGQKYEQTKETYGLTKINIWMASRILQWH